MSNQIDTLNAASREVAILAMAPLVERSAWVAELTVDARPFADHEALAAALVETILVAGPERQRSMFNVHPELAGREAIENRMTEASVTEQQRLGLHSLSAGDAQRLARMNAAYRERFGHPFIVALHRVPELSSLFEVFELRLAASPLEEHATTLAEIASVVHSRAASAFGPPAHSSLNVTATTLE
ncbi:MAG: 2-oxo-4-hydroxy-4-carboxy-5-ureidoimidazoline decarboxylase [Desulfomicrobium sp.]|uniref:2-oxo-4-hydroxy-4-carboxy-5-ureidoimidazoline decarboxylase n=1 Tax=Hoeflea sp. TaxID=1940281 RepID=UPI0025BDE1F9|nr:2-oxo-4-hydroxy-4-carboxy-5-ureidoimidazoline decarboxylase [Hoeflea sp.]MBU4527144.1 2-oxo-4-hydroxy-4-carboxy-5-ureidoimidazoline decarboxylase [Alphaproteobacteria bacterium]MBV1713914.1 2-oxo-4-hydroxy-4-carboxy-5-ureidoimidazoline decarboxylase [Desulfomicrobium sp.]MBU4544126.1 2-oxo-4-hydroxy-4-carboxy-5-ureidoimidazoline decarboxylase [Alphaproteobacteria bacterium]MBU4552326.1 2-oxo-4-hydroxy-4-carboxy-5-ureidoimidazoline decarboxylase [Alphaproteobacteria bacterium]MBV1786213.1 2-